uniref:hypothetical protein n=1 Tax=Massilia sp. DWR3-1-1 TaxID=2804559 RepID=UPI003CE96D19
PKSLALSSNAHTYRLLIVKELYSVLLTVRYEALCSLQQRGKIMQRFAFLVNLYFVSPFFANGPKFLFLLTNFSGRRTIAKATGILQGFFIQPRERFS